jgi:hypothetical protein
MEKVASVVLSKSPGSVTPMLVIVPSVSDVVMGHRRPRAGSLPIVSSVGAVSHSVPSPIMASAGHSIEPRN